MIPFHRTSRLSCAILIAGLFGACGGGGGGSGSTPPPPSSPPPSSPPPASSAPDEPILYIAIQDAANMFELYLVDPAEPGVSAKVNGLLGAGGGVGPYALSPDLSQAAYIAWQDSAENGELYVVDLAEPGEPTRLNAPLVADGEVELFRFSPDGSRIAYMAEQDVSGREELYIVDLDNPGVSTKVNPDLTADRDVHDGFIFSPDGTQILYAADQDTDDMFELYLVDLTSPGISTKVNEPFPDGAALAAGYMFSPDGSLIGYMAEQDTVDVRELYVVQVSAPGVSVKLNEPMVAGGDLCDFQFSPDSAQVAFCADKDTDGVIELFHVEVAVPGVNTRLSAPLVAGGRVFPDYAFGPNNDFIVYSADQDTDEVVEIYHVGIAAPGIATKVNAPLVANGGVGQFNLAADGLRVNYIADQETDNVFEVFSVDLATPGVSAKLNPAMAGGGAFLLQTGDESDQVFYIADQETAGAFELFVVEIAGPGASTTLSDPAAADGFVADFAIAPGVRVQ